MDHIVYLNSSAEIGQIISGEKTMLARASMGKKRPYGRVGADDTLFFVNGFRPGVKAMARAKSVISAEMDEGQASDIKKRYGRILAPESQRELLSKRFFILVELEDARPIVPFKLADGIHGGPGDWVVVENIDEVIC
jgi:hypothetical protein